MRADDFAAKFLKVTEGGTYLHRECGRAILFVIQYYFCVTYSDDRLPPPEELARGETVCSLRVRGLSGDRSPVPHRERVFPAGAGIIRCSISMAEGNHSS
jgi:hypothetical protein